MLVGDHTWKKGEDPFVVVYSTHDCPHCDRALGALRRTFGDIEVRRIDNSPAFLLDFKERGFRTVPQVMINGRHIGGADETLAYLQQMYGG